MPNFSKITERLAGRRGFALVEIIVSMIIIFIIALVGLNSAVLQRPLLRNIYDRYTATCLASSQVEDLKRTTRNFYTDPTLSSGAHNTSTLTDIPAGFTLTYTVEDKFEWNEDSASTDTIPDYKIIRVNCAYGNNNRVRLTSYIVE